MFDVVLAENTMDMENKSMKKKYLCVSIMFFVSVFLFSQELILKVKSPANIIGWVYQKEKLEDSYCVCDNNYLIFASSKNQQKPLIHIYKERMSSIISGSFYISNKQFVVLDDENTVLAARFDNLENITVRKVHENLVARSTALSPNDEMVATGFANGFVQIHYLLRHSKKNFDLHFKAHNDSIYSINFNSMGQYFISSGKDEKIKIWDAKTLSLVKEFSCYTESLCPAIFSPLNDNFAYCTSRQTLCISNIDGNIQKEIAIMDGIRLAKFTEKKDRIAVLTDSQKLEFYNVETGKFEGVIPTLENICSFDVNIVTGAILVGTEEGDVYLSSNKDIKILKDSMKQSQTKKVQINKAKREEKPKMPELSMNMLVYLGLEEEEVKESNLNKPFFPIKDETPLEEPIAFAKKIEPIKKAPIKTNIKTLNETVLDDKTIEFQKDAPHTENKEGEKTTDEVSETQEEEVEDHPDEEPKTEIQEDETKQDGESV